MENDKINKMSSNDAQELLGKSLETVFGDSGTSRYNGYYLEEPNVIWRDSQRVDIVEDMRRSDGAIKAVLNAIKAPILSTEWRIFSYDSSPKGEEIRAFVDQNIFNMRRDWLDFLREALAYLDFGHYPFEIIYEIKNGQVHLADLEPRIPASILRWEIGDERPDGTAKKGITQYIRTNDKKGLKAEIPMEKLLVLTNDKEGDDLTGQSILRATYIHWKYKNVLYRISGIAADRYGAGVPVLTMPEGGYGAEEKAAGIEMVENIRSHQKNYAVLPYGFDLKILTPNGNPMGDMMDKLIDHHNRMIMMSTLAQFLALGSDGTGSMALSQDHSSFFLKHVEDKANYFVSQFNKQVIKRLVDLNFGEQEWYPELKFLPLGEENLKDGADILGVLTTASLLDANDPHIKQYIRTRFNLPELTDEQLAEAEAEAEEPEEPIKEPEDPEVEVEGDDTGEELKTKDKKRVFLAEKPFKLVRKLTEQEERANMKLLNDDFNTYESELEDDLAEATAAEIERYADAVKKKLDAGDIAGIAGLSLMLSGATKRVFNSVIKGAFDSGKSGASAELGIDRPSTPARVAQIMSMDINDISNALVAELERKMKDVVKDGVISDASTAAIASAVRSKGKDEAARMITNTSGTVVGQYLNRGRNTVFQSNLTKIKGFQRSEVLDQATCDMCLTLDNRVIDATDPMANMDIVHTHCRGVWVPIFEVDTEQPDITGLPKSVTDSFDLVDGRPTVNAFQQLKKPVNPKNAEVQKIIRDKMGV